MMSTNQYWNHISPCDFDDLFSLLDDFNPQIQCNQYSMLHDDIIEDNISSLFEIDNYQQQTLSNNNSTQESKESNLECRVCGAPAYGYNFNQITCESCKAFFRRNALRNMSQLKCHYSGSCIININTRRQCAYCRLKKCFDVKMRKDWIRTKQEKELRQLIKLSKEQKKINDLSSYQQSFITLPISLQRRKCSTLRSISQEVITDPVNTNN
ncbi:unnamed protein product [Rotaria sp. Silwood1]|nr:unnamed protein product [Rotaria sp. Silwood1]